MIERWLEDGIQAARDGKKEEAAKLFQMVVKEDPTNYEAWLWLSDVLDDPDKRREILIWITQQDPKNHRATTRLNRLNRLVSDRSIIADATTKMDQQNLSKVGSNSESPTPFVESVRSFAPANQSMPQAFPRGSGYHPAGTVPPPSPKKKKKTGVILLLLLVGVFLCICVIGIAGGYYYTQKPQAFEEIASLYTNEEQPPSPDAQITLTLGYLLNGEESSNTGNNLPTAVNTLTPGPNEADTLTPTSSITPLPSATSLPLPQFQEDFSSGVTQQWFGNVDETFIKNGRMKIETGAKVFIGESHWNNYELSFDACKDPDTYVIFMELYFAVPEPDPDYFNGYGYALWGDFNDISMRKYTNGELNELDNTNIPVKLWDSECNYVRMTVMGSTGELFWNDTSVYQFGSSSMLNGMIGFSLDNSISIDNITVRPIE